MPKTPIDYSKTVIYKIVCNDLNVSDLYVGHTTDFIVRRYTHKSNCNNVKNIRHNYKVYKMIRDNNGWQNWTMIEIEKYPCDDSNQASARERYWYEVLNANLNSNVPNRSEKESGKEYRKNNRDVILEKQKKYRENNKEMISQKFKVRYQLNKEKLSEKFTCECGGNFSKANKSTHLKTPKHQTYCNSTILDV